MGLFAQHRRSRTRNLRAPTGTTRLMARHARIHAPGALVHIIARTHNGEFRFDAPHRRTAIVTRIANAFTRSDWSLIAYAVMSNHYHLAAIAGARAPSSLLRPMQTAVARWVNDEDARFGAVFAERAATIVVPQSRAAQLIAYIHNNPVRAGVASNAIDSDWTSHREYAGVSAPHERLDVERGLALLGLSTSERSRRSFERLVDDHATEPRSDALTERWLAEARDEARRQMALPVEVTSPLLANEPHAAVVGVQYIGVPAVDPRWNGAVNTIIERACQEYGVTKNALCSLSRGRTVSQARAFALTLGVRVLRRPSNEIAAALGISSSAASMLLRRADSLLPRAMDSAAALRAASDQ